MRHPWGTQFGLTVVIVCFLAAALSYLIVWGIWSTLKNNKIETDKDTCGFKTEGQPHNYG